MSAINLGSGRTALSISTGAYHTCALLDDHSVKCWGKNDFGQLGLGDTATRNSPEAIPVDLGTGRTAKKLRAVRNQTCAILNDDTTKCWGLGTHGELGQGDANNRGDGPNEMGDNLSAINLGEGRSATELIVGGYQVCAILNNGAAKCWGYNGSGGLGQGDLNNRGDQPDELGDFLPVINFGLTGS